MEVLRDLIEKRDAAAEAFEADAAEFRAVEGEVTEEREAQFSAKREAVLALDARIAEVRDDMKRAEALEEARAALAVAAPAVVRSEPGTYGPGIEASYYMDLAASALPGRPEYTEAVERLAQYGKEVVRDCINDSEMRSKVLAKADTYYRKDESSARRFRGAVESRAMSTGSGTGGQFVTPVYLVDEYAPFRQLGRVFIDACNKQPMPDYGMTVYIPQVTGPASVAAQETAPGTGENTTVTELDPTTAYLSNSLVTEAGQVTVSQQLLDRAGPGIQFDRIVFDQLHRNYNKVIDTAVLAAVLGTAGIGTVTNAATGSTGTNVVQSLYSDVAKAQSQMETTDGTIMSATHLFATATEWAFVLTQLDSTGRPLVRPSGAGLFNAAAAPEGDTSSRPEGYTGYSVLDYPVFKDSNIPTVVATPTQTQLVLANMGEVYLWEGDLVQRAIPQTFAQQLSVLLQVYTYYTVIVRYPKAIQQIGGARYPAAPTFLQA